ncbi:MAG: hypothetical protein JXB49_16205 [Bacteroidales bacterium]|nr:hypothetical protein [Bacteroidales bacterium]
MKCTYYKHLIVLAKIDNISARQDKQLRNHLNTCFHCKKEWEQQGKLDHTIDFIKKERLKPGNPQELTDNIISAIQRTKHTSLIERFLLLIDHVRYLLFYPRVKYVLATISMLLIGLLTLQHFEFVNDRSRLSEELKKVKYPSLTKSEVPQIYNTNLDFEKYLNTDSKKIKLLRSEYFELLNQILTLEEENMQLRNMLGNGYEQLLTNIETEYKQDLTPEQRAIIKKLKEI